MKLLIILPGLGLVFAIVSWFASNILPQLMHVLKALGA